MATASSPRALGVTIVHQFYPGFIDLPEKTQYLIVSDDLRGSVQLLRHVRPLVVTDFDNALVKFTDENGRPDVKLQRSIEDVGRDAVIADAIGLEGRTAPAIAVEKSITGRIFYQEIYTELQTCTEFFSANKSENLATHNLLIDRFIGTYRYINPDVRLRIVRKPLTDTTPLRLGQYLYSSQEQNLPFEIRIQGIRTGALDLSTVATARATQSLIDHVGDPDLLDQRADNVGAHLANGFSLSENLLEIERLADLAFTDKRPRAAVIEAISILEAGIWQAHERVSRLRVAAKPLKRRDEVSLKELINKFLPVLLTHYEGDSPPLLKRADEAREIRNRVAHEQYEPTSDEVNLVLSIIRSLLTILEIDEKFKGNYKMIKII